MVRAQHTGSRTFHLITSFTGRAVGPAGERPRHTGPVPGPQAPLRPEPFLLLGFHVGRRHCGASAPCTTLF